MKVDLRREVPSYAATRTFGLVTVPPLRYLMVDGHGDPNTSPAYEDALGTLFPVAYALKAVGRRELGRDHAVPPLEGLWWSDDMAAFTDRRDKATWDWTMLSLVPDWLTEVHVGAARADVAAKRRAPLLDALRVGTLDEGLCAQVLHVGSYDDEAPLLASLHGEWLPAHGLRPTGRHHEIYLADPRRTPPERLRTILRQPVERV